MPDRPIIFSALMVRALLDGRKTQTRRLLKPQHDSKGRGFLDSKLPYATGDRLWVREAWSGDYDMRAIKPQDRFGPARQPIWYWADTKRDCGQWERPRSPIHMPRWASRITLTVTDVRVQRVQEISEADAWAEGCKPGEMNDRGEPFPDEEPHPKGGTIGWDCARDWYSDLWNTLHGTGAWDANPWVAALAFTVRKGNIDHG